MDYASLLAFHLLCSEDNTLRETGINHLDNVELRRIYPFKSNSRAGLRQRAQDLRKGSNEYFY